VRTGPRASAAAVRGKLRLLRTALLVTAPGSMAS